MELDFHLQFWLPSIVNKDKCDGTVPEQHPVMQHWPDFVLCYKSSVPPFPISWWLLSLLYLKHATGFVFIRITLDRTISVKSVLLTFFNHQC